MDSAIFKYGGVHMLSYLFKSFNIGLMISGLVLAGCGDDDEKKEAPMGPTQEEAVAITAGLTESLVAGFDKAVTGGGTLDGMQGVLRIAGTTWTFEGYSADGQLVIDGDLTVNPTAYPATATGELTLSGSQEGTLKVDITVDLSTGTPVFVGTLTLNGTAFDVAELIAGVSGGFTPLLPPQPWQIGLHHPLG